MDSNEQAIQVQIKDSPNYYYKNKQIGQGAFGIVYEGHREVQGRKLFCCVKIIEIGNAPPIQLKMAREELQLMEALQGLNNPNLVTVYDVQEDAKAFYVVMQKCETDLRKIIFEKDKKKPADVFPQEEVYKFMQHTINAFKDIKLMGIMHRDVKPANFLYDKGEYKLADFGASKIVSEEQRKKQTIVGTPLFAAPQLFSEEPYTDKLDIYSFGVVVYKMIYGTYPLMARSQPAMRQLHEQVRTKPIKCPDTGQHERDLLDIVEKLLSYDEADRPDWEDLFQIPKLKRQQVKRSRIRIVES